MFLSIISKVLPLYIVTLQGFIAGLLHEIHNKSISKLMFHFLLPLIFFDVAVNIKMEVRYIALPILFFLMAVFIREFYLRFTQKMFPDDRYLVVSYASSSVNINSLGLSFAMIIFNDEYIRIFMLSAIGFVLQSQTLGQYTLSGHMRTWRVMSKKILKMPIFHCFTLGIVANLFDIKLFNGFDNLFNQIRGAYLVLGMMLFGLSLSKVSLNGGAKFMALFLSSKIIVSPLLYFLLILVDKYFLHIYNNEMYKLFFVMSALPPGIECIGMCTIHAKFPEKAALGVFLSTLIATVYISFFVPFF
jgi:predicted permease